MIQNLKPETVSFERANPAAYNPRFRLRPEDPEYQQILASLNEFGYLGGMVWNRRTGNLVGGHQRMWIMQDQGLTESTMAVVDLDEVREKDLNVRLNSVHGRWDIPQLEAVLRELEQVPNLDLGALGFSRVDLNTYLGKTPKRARRDPDAAASIPANPLTKTGDVYTLAGPDLNPQHRLVCGDSESRDTFRQAMQERRAKLIFTDPPYGVSYTNTQRGSDPTWNLIGADELRAQALQDFLRNAFQHLHSFSHDKAAFYCFFANLNHIEFESALKQAGWRVKQQLVWIKHFAISRQDYHWAHEPIFFACKQGHNCEWLGPRTQTTVFARTAQDLARMKKEEAIAALLALKAESDIWEEPKDPPTSYVHPTQKPVALAARAMANSSMPGDLVLDCFAGSGSTIIAGEMHRRPVVAIEKDPAHCDSIVQRFLETFEGAVATRNGQDLTLGELLAGPQA